MSRVHPARRAFSLLEVVLAIGVFAVAVIALVGMSGPLLREISDEQTSGELEPILGATRQWVANAAQEDFGSLRQSLQGEGHRIFVYQREVLAAATGDGSWGAASGRAGWTAGEWSELASAVDLAQGDLTLGGSAVFVADLVALPEPAGARPRGYVPVEATLRKLPRPEPGGDLAAWLEEVADSPVGQRFHLVALP